LSIDSEGDPVILRLVESFAGLAPDLTGLGPDDALRVITERCVLLVPGADAAGVTRATEDSGFETVAPTSSLATRVDAIQYELGSGPCVDAAVESSIYRTGDLSRDERWPEFGKRAVDETGVQSMLAFRMFLEDDEHIAALNVYSTERDAFDDQDRLTGLVLATYGALAVTSARRMDRIVNLERALASNRDIGVAIGVLMGLHRITRDQAFDLLRMASQARHRKLADIARSVAETGSLDPL
jgi:hypothetical protein